MQLIESPQKGFKVKVVIPLLWNFINKKVAKLSEISDVLFLPKYPLPLSHFVQFCLTPPTPPKIGHHLCTFPNLKNQV